MSKGNVEIVLLGLAVRVALSHKLMVRFGITCRGCHDPSGVNPRTRVMRHQHHSLQSRRRHRMMYNTEADSDGRRE